VIDLRYSITIESTDDPAFFSFYSTELEGFTGVGSSVEDCLCKAKWGMEEHVALLTEEGFPVPAANPDPQILIHNSGRVRAA
jgi:predicted RNase H-like HicB family nuclease